MFPKFLSILTSFFGRAPFIHVKKGGYLIESNQYEPDSMESRKKSETLRGEEGTLFSVGRGIEMKELRQSRGGWERNGVIIGVIMFYNRENIIMQAQFLSGHPSI